MKEYLQINKDLVEEEVQRCLGEFILEKALSFIKDPDDAQEVAERIFEEMTEPTHDLGAENEG